MSTETTTATTTTEAPKTSPKDDFVLASDKESKALVTEPAQEIEKVEAAATSDVVETEEVEQAEVEETEAELEASESKDKPKKKGGFQRRVDKLTREKEELRRDNELLRAKAAALEVQKQKPSGDTDAPKLNADTSKKPDSKDFETHEAFTEALADWKFDQKRAAEKAQEREAQVRKDMATEKQTHIDRMKEFEKATPDFEDALEGIRNMNAPLELHKAIMKSEFGPQIMYELAQSPEEFQRIASLDPILGLKAIYNIEAKFESSSAKKELSPDAPKAPAKKVTSAPKPISTINSKVGTTPSIRDELPYDQWVKVRNAELRNG